MPRSHNPFEPLSPASLAGIYEWPDEALRFLAGEFECLHVVGACGMGKSALLRQIERRLTHDGAVALYTCVPLDGPLHLWFTPDLSVALIDETDRLPRRALLDLLSRLRHARCRCVLAGHRRQSRDIRRAGFAPEHLELTPLPAEALRAIWERRVTLAFGEGEDTPKLTAAAAQALRQASRGNIERALQIGYEVFEDLSTLRGITARDIEVAAVSLDRALGGAEASR
jgi:hypothetical protein